MGQPLFLDPSLKMEKVAFDTRIDEDPEQWPVSVIREAHKQLPFLRDYENEVEFDKMDSSRGYAVGKMLIWPARMVKEAAAQMRQLVTVPIIIRDRELSPLDVYTHNGAMLPMDQGKVAQVLFRPQAIEGSAPMGQFTGTNLYGQMIPPNTDHQYNAGTLHKHGSAQFWHAALRTFRPADVNALGEKLASDHGLRRAFTSTPVLLASLREMLDAVETSKTASAQREERLTHLKPTVVQLREDGKGYLCKTANHHCFAPLEHKITRFQAQEMLSKEAFDRLLGHGWVTYTTEAVTKEAPTTKVASEADRIGTYRVWRGGRAVEGIVVPHVVDFDGRQLDMQVFAGGESHSLQEKVAGVFLNDVNLQSDPPRGLGVFVYQEGPYAVATEPVDIQATVKVATEHGTSGQLVGTRMSTGAPLQLYVVPGLRKIAMVGNEVALPESVRFLALRGGQARVSQSPDDAGLAKTSSASVELVSDGHCFALRGHHARAFPAQDMLAHEAEFALCALGLTGRQAQESMKVASSRGSVRIPNTRMVVPEGAAAAPMLRKAASVVTLRPETLRVDLTKELALLTAPAAEELWKQASVMMGKESVNNILSLNFVTPENASLYVAYLPELEKVSSKLAELLVASRLGMDDVRETAAKNAMTQVNAVIRGLEGLRERIN